MNTSNYNTGNGTTPSFSGFKTMLLAEVVLTQPVKVNQTEPGGKNKDLIYNSDPYIIRCRIIGAEYDNIFSRNDDLPNCFPMLPKFNAPIPKVGETVLVFLSDSNDRYGDRFYIGPIISNLSLLNKQTFLGGSTSNLSTGIYLPQKDISKVESSKGIYAEYDTDNTVVVQGRNNSDIVFKNSEVLIRAGKFVENKPEEFNQINPAYMQIKNGFIYNDSTTKNTTVTSYFGSGGPIFEPNTKKISVNNIVADKINLLTYKGSPTFNLTQRNLANNTTPYITDEELNKILEEAHPLVFGDVLLEYLKAFRSAFENHVHNKFGAAPPTDNITQGYSVNDFKTLAPKLEGVMLSKNVRTN
jgi:hypothetical protein